MKKRGFALMDKDRLKAIASLGGTAAKKTGKTHKWNSKEARKAGKIGLERRWGGKTGPASPQDGPGRE